MEFLQNNVSQLELQQQIPWRAEFLATGSRLSMDETRAFDNALPTWEKSWNSEFLNSQWEEKFKRVSKALHQQSLEKSWEDQFKETNVEADIDWNEKFKDIFNESKSEWTREFLESPKITDHVNAPDTEYIFEVDNPFMGSMDPFAEGQRLLDSGQLSQAALAFEAAVQKSPSHSEAWFYLGTTQAENEKERPAILALEKSIKEDPRHAPALLVIHFFYSLGSSG
jgi:peroxin-5